MSAPDPATFRAVLAGQDLGLSEERLRRAVEGHRAMRPALERLRAIPLSYVEPVLEPGTSLAWIERGGAG